MLLRLCCDELKMRGAYAPQNVEGKQYAPDTCSIHRLRRSAPRPTPDSRRKRTGNPPVDTENAAVEKAKSLYHTKSRLPEQIPESRRTPDQRFGWH